MSTRDIPDDELDDFFRKSLGKPDLDFREEDWLKMEQKLNDKHASKRATYRKFLYGLLGLLLVFVSILTWYFISLPSPTAVAIREKGITENSAENTTAGDVKNDIGSTSPTVAAQSVLDKDSLEKSNEVSLDMVSPSGSKTEQAAKKEISKQKNVPGQNGLVSNDPLVEGVPSASLKKTSPANELAYKDQQNGKQPTIEKTTPITAGLLSGKSEQSDENGDHKKANNKNGVNEGFLAQNQQDKPIKKQHSAIIVQDAKKNKQLPEFKNQLDNNQRPVSEITVPDKDIQKQAINTTSGESFIIPPRQNGQGERKYIQNEASGPDHENYIAQVNNIYPIEAIPGLSARIIAYETQLTNLITQHANPLVKPGQRDSSRQHKLAIEKVSSRVSVNLLVSPDLSSIGFSQWRAPGTNLGVSLEFLISNRVSISVGAIYSTKIYAADAKKYNPDNPYWASYYPKPVDVKGNCKVIDLPVNIRYNFLARERYNVYLSGGLSSYLMLREDYTYIYSAYDTGPRSGWHGKNENKHFFKVINLSGGYERKLNRRFSLQAEPFIKLPTAGVGYGRIKLLSTGLFMSVKCNL